MSDFKGFSGAPKVDSDVAIDSSYFACGILALQCDSIEEAYRCFFKFPDSVSALFNLALCFYKTGLYEKALDALDCAEKKVAQKASPLPQAAGSIPVEVIAYDAVGYGYRSPMAKDVVDLLPTQARLRILRFKADLCGTLGYEQEFIKMLPSFSGKSYQNIEDLKAKIIKV